MLRSGYSEEGQASGKAENTQGTIDWQIKNMWLMERKTHDVIGKSRIKSNG